MQVHNYKQKLPVFTFFPPPTKYNIVDLSALCYLPHVTVHIPNSTSLTTVVFETKHKVQRYII